MKSLKRFLTQQWWAAVISTVVEITGRWRFANGITTTDVYADHVSGFFATESGVRKKVLTDNTVIDQADFSKNINVVLRQRSSPALFSRILGTASGQYEDWGGGFISDDQSSQLGLQATFDTYFREIIVNTDRGADIDSNYWGTERDWGVITRKTGAGAFKAGLIFPTSSNMDELLLYLGSSQQERPKLRVYKNGEIWIGGTLNNSKSFGVFLKLLAPSVTSSSRNRMIFGFDNNVDAFEFLYVNGINAFAMEAAASSAYSRAIVFRYADYPLEVNPSILGYTAYNDVNTVAPQGAIYSRIMASVQRGFLSYTHLSSNAAPAAPYERGLLYISQDVSVAWLALGPYQLHEIPLNQDTIYFNTADRELYTYNGSALVEYVPAAAGVSWGDVTGKPESFTPAAHSHSWGSVTGKPSVFPPEAHSHSWESVTGKPSVFPPETHSHAWGSITDKPTEFTPAAHSHTWESVTDKPESFPPSSHSHSWESVTGKPSVFPPEAHSHSWESVTGKPSTFAPAAHSHSWTDIEGKPESFTPAAHSHNWESVTDKPSVFPPEAHSHSWESVTGKPSTFAPAAHSHNWSDIEGKPESFTPAAHSHSWESVTGKPTEFTPAAHLHTEIKKELRQSVTFVTDAEQVEIGKINVGESIAMGGQILLMVKKTAGASGMSVGQAWHYPYEFIAHQFGTSFNTVFAKFPVSLTGSFNNSTGELTLFAKNENNPGIFDSFDVVAMTTDFIIL